MLKGNLLGGNHYFEILSISSDNFLIWNFLAKWPSSIFHLFQKLVNIILVHFDVDTRVFRSSKKLFKLFIIPLIFGNDKKFSNTFFNKFQSIWFGFVVFLVFIFNVFSFCLIVKLNDKSWVVFDALVHQRYFLVNLLLLPKYQSFTEFDCEFRIGK